MLQFCALFGDDGEVGRGGIEEKSGDKKREYKRGVQNEREIKGKGGEDRNKERGRIVIKTNRQKRCKDVIRNRRGKNIYLILSIS